MIRNEQIFFMGMDIINDFGNIHVGGKLSKKTSRRIYSQDP
jgi:hypothetical protein